MYVPQPSALDRQVGVVCLLLSVVMLALIHTGRQIKRGIVGSG